MPLVACMLRVDHHCARPFSSTVSCAAWAIMFLSGSTSTCIHAPGIHHRARWMEKLSYCLKIYLLRSEFPLEDEELQGIKQLNLFAMAVYLKAWFLSTFAISAPRQDLERFKKLVDYRQINESVSPSSPCWLRW